MPLTFGCPGTGKITVAKCGLALSQVLYKYVAMVLVPGNQGKVYSAML